MKIKAFVSTNKVGSKCQWETEIDDEHLEGLSPDEREKLISEQVREEMTLYMEWGWTEE